jgi:3-mercaptopyruvate sulfurtransferase SseA
MFRRTACRCFSALQFDQVKQIVSDLQRSAPCASNIVLIDVRSPGEIRETGLIPFAINIPVEAVATVLREDYDKDEFEDVFGREKPTQQGHRLVFYCKSGGRSAIACSMAESLGFQSVSNYGGSWMEWSSKHSEQK